MALTPKANGSPVQVMERQMNLRQMKTNEIALLLHGLRAVWVHDEAATHAKLTKQLEGELAARGARLSEAA